MGNFFIRKEGSIGTFDFQVLSEEHPLRDVRWFGFGDFLTNANGLKVAYFLSSSYNEELLPTDEEELIRFYLSKLEEFGVKKRCVRKKKN